MQPVLTEGAIRSAWAVRSGLAHRRVLVFFLSSCLIAALIIHWMQSLRLGRYEFSELPIFYSLFVFQDYWPAVVGLMCLVAALLPPVGAFGMRLVAVCGSRPLTVAAITTLCACVGSFLVYRHQPLSMDEYAAVFQSQAFAAGHLTGHFPTTLMDWLVPPGFQGQFIIVSHQSGAVASSYWPGFALLLTPFNWIAAPWAVNAILGGLTVLLVHRLTLRLLGSQEAAGFAVLLTLASPVITINAMSYYSMPAHLVANMGFALLLLEPTARRSFWAGVLGSFALVLHNPVPHILFAIPWLLWLLVKRELRGNLVFVILGYLPLCIVLGVGWQMFLHGLTAADTTGAASDGPHLSFVDTWLAAFARVFVLPTGAVWFARLVGLLKMWIWAVPGLLLLAGWGAFKERRNVRLMLLAASAVSTFAGYLFVPFDQGHGWGFRYFHSAWFALPVLAIAAMYKTDDPGATRLRNFVAGLAALSLLSLTSIDAVNVRGHIDRHLAQIPKADKGVPQVVFVNRVFGYYAVDLVQNDPFLRKRPLMLVSHGLKADTALMSEHFPELKMTELSYRGSVWSDPAR